MNVRQLTRGNAATFFNETKIGDLFTYSESFILPEVRELARKNNFLVQYCPPESEPYKRHGAMTVRVTGRPNVKAVIRVWAGGCTEALQSLDYYDGEELELDEEGLKNLAYHLFQTGLNVMLRHSDDGNVTVFVDYKSFTQR